MLYYNSGNRIFWECIVWIYVERDNIEFVHPCFFHQELLNLYPLVVQIDKMMKTNLKLLKFNYEEEYRRQRTLNCSSEIIFSIHVVVNETTTTTTTTIIKRIARKI